MISLRRVEDGEVTHRFFSPIISKLSHLYQSLLDYRLKIWDGLAQSFPCVAHASTYYPANDITRLNVGLNPSTLTHGEILIAKPCELCLLL